MPYEGQTGTAKDGTPVVFRGGKIIPQSDFNNPYAAATHTQKYSDAIAAQRAKSDVAKMDAASEAVMTAGQTSANADQIQQILRRTATGPGAGIAAAGSNWNPLSNHQYGTDIQALDRLGNAGVFGDLGKLKGPMSDRDVAFLRSQQVSPKNWGPENQNVVDLMRWSSRRATQYEAGLNAWTEKLGSPSARNAKGQSYEAWWGDWSAKHIPRPDLAVKGAPQARPKGPIPQVQGRPPAGVEPAVWASMTPEERALWK